MSRPIIVLCVADLRKLIPHFEKEMLDDKKHKSDMRALLHNLGFDIDYGIEYQEGMLSRTKFWGVVLTDRIVGTERVDVLWRLSGNSSHEAREYSEDKTLQQELSKMKRGTREKKENKKEVG